MPLKFQNYNTARIFTYSIAFILIEIYCISSKSDNKNEIVPIPATAELWLISFTDERSIEKARQFASGSETDCIKMKIVAVIAALLILQCSSSCLVSASWCQCYQPDIFEVLNPYARSYGLSLEGSCTEYTRTVIDHLLRQTMERYVTSRSETYKVMVEKLKLKSSDVGIPNEGLISGRTRLLKLLEFYEARHANKIEQIRRLKSRTNACKGQTLENEIDSLNQNHTANMATALELQTYLKCLKMQGKILEAKLNNNSPAIHGSMGIITGNIMNSRECIKPINVDLSELSDGSMI